MEMMQKIYEGFKSNKNRIINSFFALTSIALAHYAGFLMVIPVQIVAAAGGAMAPGVTATFIFYVAFCAVVARAAVGIIQLIIIPFFLLHDRIIHGFKLQGINKKRRYVRSYYSLLRNEGYLWLGLQASIFLVALFGLYVDFTFTWKSGTFVILAIAGVLLSGAFRAKYLLILKWKVFLERFRGRDSFRLNAASAAFVTITSALVVASLCLGVMRMSLLKKAAPQQVSNEYFTGYAKLLASSGSSTLLYEEVKDDGRYIYAASDYAIAIESKKNSFPVISRK